MNTQNPNDFTQSSQNTTQARQPESFLHPALDIFEDGDAITLEADMPGVSKDRLTVHVEGDNLLLEGRVVFGIPEHARALYADVRSTLYRCSFVLSRELEVDQIRASLKDGVLQVRVPKRAESKPRRIAIEA
jgi:HSP20 family protein